MKLVLLAAAITAVAFHASAQQPPASVARMIEQHEVLNDKCRGGSGDSAATWKACDKRDALYTKIEKAGWCWGPQAAAGFEKHWTPCSDDQRKPAKKAWFVFDVNRTTCFQSKSSPADRIRTIQEYGEYAQVYDLPGGAVEVGEDIGGGRTQVWTYYSAMDKCIASLPRSKAINSKYE